MKNRKILLATLLSIVLVFSLILPASAAGASATVPPPDDHLITHLAVDSLSVVSEMALNTPAGNVTPMVAVGERYWNYGQCDVGGWTDITQVAAGAAHTVGLKSDGTVVAVGNNNHGQCDVGGWNLVLAVPPSQYVLTISGTPGGSVTTPGEGVFTRNAGTIVDLVAEPEEGYRFVYWGGDMDTIADVTASTTNITMQGDYSITANFVSVEPGAADIIKAGDRIKYKYTTTGWPEPYPEWMKLEFLSVEGTNANVLVTLHISDGTEQRDTVPVDLAEGGGGAFGLSGFVVSPNLTTGDSIYMTGFGNVTVAGETTIYAGARRAVVYARLSSGLTYYWDKLTGVMAEVSGRSSGMTVKATVTETNIWELAAPDVGIKAGDWIKMKGTTSGGGAQRTYPWVMIEFLSIEGTSANVGVTMHMSDGTVQTQGECVDVVAGGHILGLSEFGLSGVVISANLTTGDSIYMTRSWPGDYGEVRIEGETTRTYAGARRTVVYASISQYGAQLSCYWDKLTGVMVESSETHTETDADGTTTTYKTTYKVIETNMWESTTSGMPWWMWIIVAAAIGAVAFFMYRLKKRKTPTTPTPPTEGT